MPRLPFTPRRKLPRSSRVLFAVAAALALAAFLLVRAETGRADRALRAAGPMAAVVVAARDIAAGAAIGPADVRTTSIPKVYVPPEAVTSAEAAVGLVSAAPIRRRGGARRHATWPPAGSARCWPRATWR